MILVVDVGNTNITCGVYEEKELKATFRINTKTQRTSDEYGAIFSQLLSMKDLLILNMLRCIAFQLIMNLMLQAGPEIHGNRTYLYLHFGNLEPRTPI